MTMDGHVKVFGLEVASVRCLNLSRKADGLKCFQEIKLSRLIERVLLSWIHWLLRNPNPR